MPKSVQVACIRCTGSRLFGILSLVVCAGSLHAAREAKAEPSSISTADKKRAASLFDRGVREYSRGDYSDAAHSFLEADELTPSSHALMNALSAAHRSDDPVLLLQVVDRALNRGELSETELSLVRRAQADANEKVARIDADCSGAPCSLELDGQPVTAGSHVVLPGTHDIVGIFPDQRRMERVRAAAGSIYRISVRPRLDPSASPAQGVRTTPHPPPLVSKAPQASLETSASLPGSTAKPLPVAAFVAGCVGTGLFVGLTTWSGLRAVSARKLHEDDPAAYDPDEVRRRERQTDAYLLGSVVLGAATAVAGLWFTDFHSRTRVAFALTPGTTAQVHLEKRF